MEKGFFSNEQWGYLQSDLSQTSNKSNLNLVITDIPLSSSANKIGSILHICRD